MHQQKRNVKLVCQLFHLPYLIIVVTVRGIRTAVTHDLKGIDCNEYCVGMLFNEGANFITETFDKWVRRRCKKSIRGNVICDAVKPFLHTPERILQAKIQGCTFGGRHTPHTFSFGDADTYIQHQPRFADFRCAAEDSYPLRQQRVDTKLGRIQSCIH